MDISVLLSSLLETFISFWLDLVIGGAFDLLSDVLFGGAGGGLV